MQCKNSLHSKFDQFFHFKFFTQDDTYLNALVRPFYDKHYNDLNHKNLYGRNNKDKSFKYQSRLLESAIPPFLKKRLKRFKSLYETMHPQNHEKKSPHYGNFEYLRKNEIPDYDFITQRTSQKSSKWNYDLHKDNKKHHHLRSNQKIKKVRSKPLASIMQKKVKNY